MTGCPSKTAKDGGPGPAGGLSDSATGGSSLGSFIEGENPPEGGRLKAVRFDYDRYDLDEAARSTLAANANWLNRNRGARVEVEGHCDERGSVEYNLALGAKRANAARDYLVTLGIDSGRLSTISYGEELPVCREATESCFSRNRRGHFVVLK